MEKTKDRRRGGSSREEGRGAAEWSAELERVSLRLTDVAHKTPLFSCATEMNDWANDMRPLGEAFASLEPQLTHASSMVREELRQIKAKEEGHIREHFGRQIDEYKEAKTHMKRLEVAHEEHAENATNLSDDLQCLSEELDLMKKNLDGEASSVSDATPLAEIRAAIQRLRKENKELDVYLGVLDYELTQARMNNASPREHSYGDDVSEDDHSLDKE